MHICGQQHLFLERRPRISAADISHHIDDVRVITIKRYTRRAVAGRDRGSPSLDCRGQDLAQAIAIGRAGEEQPDSAWVGDIRLDRVTPAAAAESPPVRFVAPRGVDTVARRSIAEGAGRRLGKGRGEQGSLPH